MRKMEFSFDVKEVAKTAKKAAGTSAYSANKPQGKTFKV